MKTNYAMCLELQEKSDQWFSENFNWDNNWLRDIDDYLSFAEKICEKYCPYGHLPRYFVTCISQCGGMCLDELGRIDYKYFHTTKEILMVFLDRIYNSCGRPFKLKFNPEHSDHLTILIGREIGL